MKISCLFPMYNEEGNVLAVVTDALSQLGKVCDEFEVIIVNDGSRDRTRQIAEQLAREDRRVRVINHLKNQGYGAALCTGFAAARYDLIFQSDGDNQFYFEDIGRLLPFVNDYDFVIGYRIKRGDPLPRLLLAFFYRTLLWSMFGLRLRDANCAFKFYNKSILDQLDLKSSSAVINGEIFAKARQLGYDRIKEVGVRHRPRQSGRQTGGSFRVLWSALTSILGLWQLCRDFSRQVR
ncbi:glycosyltransferase family 2 protein [Candidatus Margulisiibacteriota bacterium]